MKCLWKWGWVKCLQVWIPALRCEMCLDTSKGVWNVYEYHHSCVRYFTNTSTDVWNDYENVRVSYEYQNRCVKMLRNRYRSVNLFWKSAQVFEMFYEYQHNSVKCLQIWAHSVKRNEFQHRCAKFYKCQHRCVKCLINRSKGIGVLNAQEY